MTYNSAIPFLGMRPKELKTCVHTKTWTQALRAALSEESKGGNDSNVHQ